MVIIKMNKAVLLDRDGIINKEKKGEYITSTKDFELLPNVGKHLKTLQDLGYHLIVITNQSAVNRGLITHNELEKIHNLMKSQLASFGITINEIYYCPHRPDENCDCRKPKTMLILQAINDHHIDIKNSWLIGDKDSDIEAGKRLNIKTIKVETNMSLESAIYRIINSL